jgi:uncharacterized membrane-anchored protein
MIFGIMNWQIADKERLRTSGRVVLLELAPVDPRSLMQGDYMALNFALARDIGGRMTLPSEQQGSGVAILTLDERQVGHLARLDNGGPLNPGEVPFRYRIRRGAVWLGTNAFFFHEGDEPRYRGARLGEFRVNEAGDAMLVGLQMQ